MSMELANYQIAAQIYESPNSIVYRGNRKSDNQPLILKQLKQDYPTPSELTRYKQEYEITSHLNLEGVIRTYGLEEYQRTLVILVEDFGGLSLKEWMDGRRLFIPEFLTISIKIAEILGNIHKHNVIHKDINPANIIINPQTEQIKIIDFGISTQLTRENPTLKNVNILEGTLAYISPEQTGRMNRSLDYRTDFYSQDNCHLTVMMRWKWFTVT
jgi:serine/threonine protein kinase